MLEQILNLESARFRASQEATEHLTSLCESSGGAVRRELLGRSEGGRDIFGFTFGEGPVRVSLIGGNHSDEPVGPETLRTLVAAAATGSKAMEQLVEQCTFAVVPHTNPDGEDRNRAWIESWPDAEAYLRHAFRELPGRDVEFAFPDGRVETRMVAEFLSSHGPYDLHCSLHGMGFSDGAFLLIERHWGFRTLPLQDKFRRLAAEAGLGLHDHNRQGEKGFFYLGPGFNTTPEGEAMRTFFLSRGDVETAARFRMSSMEYVRSLGGDPLCLVSELPLFLIGKEVESEPGRPSAYLAFRERLPAVRDGGEPEAARKLLDEFAVRPLDLPTAMRIQLGVIEAGIAAVMVR